MEECQKEHIYKPLPSCLTIKESNIHGLGLFAKEKIKENTLLGISHINSGHIEKSIFSVTESFEYRTIEDYYINSSNLKTFNGEKTELDIEEIFLNGLIRTPIGGFVNHSNDPNSILIYIDNGLWGIKTIKEIEENTEITLDYKFTPCGIIKSS